MPYITLIAVVVVIMPVVTVIAVSVGVAVVRIRSIVARIAAVWIVAVSVTWIAKSDPDSSDANRNLSV
jgi:hypothetical protein